MFKAAYCITFTQKGIISRRTADKVELQIKLNFLILEHPFQKGITEFIF